MKKIMTAALALLAAASMTVAVSARQSYTAASGTAVLDGKMDNCYLAATPITANVEIAGTEDGFATGTAYAVWDAENIYVYAEITDPVISTTQGDAVFQSDSVEVYIDLLNEEGNEIANVNAAQYTAGYLYVDDNLQVTSDYWAGGGYHFNNNKENAVAVFDVSNKAGYSVEFRIPWGDEFQPAADAKIGFTFAINDAANDEAGREYQVFPDEELANAWMNTTNYGEMTLSADVYVAPQPEVPAEEVPAETPAEESAPVSAPTTADAGIAAALLAAAAAAIVVSKKR